VPYSFGRWPSARQWKPTNADSVVTENNDRARRKVVGNWHKVGLDDCELVGRPASGELPISRIDGLVARERASRLPKSVSAEMSTRSSVRARSRTTLSVAAWRPWSRRAANRARPP
jgi:hypothetical protein